MKYLEKLVIFATGIASLAGFLLALPIFLLALACRNRGTLRWLPVLAVIGLLAFQGYMEEDIDWWLWREDISYTKFYRYSSPGSWWLRRNELWRYVMERDDSSLEEFVAFFLQHGADPNEGLKRFFFYYPNFYKKNSDANENKALQLLLAAGADPNETFSGNTPLEQVIKNKDFDLAQTLLCAGATLRERKDSEGRTLLHLAAMGGAEPDFLKELAAIIGPSAWQSVDYSGRTPIHCLSTIDQLAVFTSSSEILAQPSRTGANLLHYSIQDGNRRLFDRLLEMGFDPGTPDASGCPALAYARNYRTFSDLRALMPADYPLAGESRKRLWFRALQTSSEEFILAIIAEGIDPKAALPNSNYPIHEIIGSRNAPRLIEILASAGADIQALDRHQNTPLHRAIEQYNASAAQTLLDLGVSSRALNARGQTPLSLAVKTLDAVKRVPRNLSMNGLKEEFEACRPWEALIRRLKNLGQVAEVELPGDEAFPEIESSGSGSGVSAYNSGDSSSSEREKLCPGCSGSGNCQSCYGGGQVTDYATMKRVQCRQCRGTGRCQTCGGKGRVR